ncbi:MAG TPA: hypothetical protein VFP84_12755 [Kofleriaceae bacterium]|nr:hypothetical protein [Kofleriaceae bacterium]
MRDLLALTLIATAGLAVTSCKSVDCGEGTTERDGACVAANEAVSNAMCGPGTMLDGTQCVPVLPPAVCDDQTTQGVLDPATGVTTCFGTGAATSCSTPLPCAKPSDGTQAICGQIYDFETGAPYAVANPTGARCAAPAASGPCALGIKAYDAVAFAGNPATPPLTASVAIDDCGRFQVTGIAQPGGPAIALALDDATAGPGGLTNAVGTAVLKAPNTATANFAHFVVPSTTTAKWDAGGSGPSITAGFYAPLYRAHLTGLDTATGVTPTIAPANNPTAQAADANRDFFFAGTTHGALDGALNATAGNGGALLTGANFNEVYSGAGGGIPAGCTWEIHPGSAVPGAVFVQVFRPTAIPNQTCNP